MPIGGSLQQLDGPDAPGSVQTEQPAWREYAAIGLASATVLLVEICITRVLSVILWYHFAYLAISLAMLGVGAPGVWFALRPPSARTLPRVLRTAAVLLPLSVFCLFEVGKRWKPDTGLQSGYAAFLDAGLLAVIVLVLLPMIFLGCAVCVLLLRASGPRIGRMYGADLLGAMVGATLAVPLMHVFPTPHIIAGVGLLPLLAALLVAPAQRWSTIGLGACLCLALLWGRPFELHFAAKSLDVGEILYEKWSPTARILFSRNTADEVHDTFGWGFGTKYVPTAPRPRLALTLDQAAATVVVDDPDAPGRLDHLLYDVTSVAHQWKPPTRVCVIGAGGGRDILTALSVGAQSVDAVELNPYIVQTLSSQFREESGDVYNRRGVHAVISEGRSYLTHSAGAYDLIQISMIDSWAATAAGAFALSENYLYTVEAMRLYWEHLAPTGLLAVTRWYSRRARLESPRLALVAVAALRSEGVADPSRHLVVVQAGDVATLIVSKEAVTGPQLARLDRICQERGFIRHWPPYPGMPAESLVAAALVDGAAPFAAVGINLTPCTDDAPFFFQTMPVFHLPNPAAQRLFSMNGRAVIILQGVLAITVVAAGSLYFVPFVFGGRLTRAPGFWRGSAYFTSIGLAFMLAEVPWVQRFVLYLGHPSYATTIVLATILLGAGCGSLSVARGRFPVLQRRIWMIPALVLVINMLLQPVFTTTLGWAFPVRVAVTIALLLPPSFTMGLAFPLGMLRFGDTNKAWFWAVNGAAGVLASVSSLALSMQFGFRYVTLFAVVLYVLAAAVMQGAPADTSDVSPELATA